MLVFVKQVASLIKSGVKLEAGFTGIVSSPCLVEIGWGEGSKLTTSTARVSQRR